MPSQGKIDLNFKTGQAVNALLYDFDDGATYLKPAHKSWLDVEVVARFKDQPVNIAVWGYAGHSSIERCNYPVAVGRAEAVVNYLRSKGFPQTAFKWTEGSVDDKGTRDANADTWRSANIHADQMPLKWLE